MAVTHVGVSAVASAASGNMTVTPPTTQTDDIMILGVTARDNVAITLPADWTIFSETNNGASCRVTLAWKRCVGAEGQFTVTHTAGANILGAVSVYRGCAEVGSPIDAFAALTGAQTFASAIKPTAPNCMVVFFIGVQANVTVAAPYRAVDPLILTERFNGTTGSGGNTTLAVLADGVKSKAMGTSTGVARTATTATNVSVLIALRGEPRAIMRTGKIVRSSGKLIQGAV